MAADGSDGQVTAPSTDGVLGAPSGWFSLGLASDVPVGAVKSFRVGGREIVAFRGASGVLGVLDAYCPHLGAHLGHGGTVQGDGVRCPFHGFEFDATGTCTATGYGMRVPPRARAVSWPVIERHGIALVYLDPTRGGAPPAFDVPEIDTVGWTPFVVDLRHLRGHPQETTENSVDVGHFAHVHGYTDVALLEPLDTDGAYLTIRYGFTRQMIPNVAVSRIRSEIDLHVFGLGYSRVEYVEQLTGVRTRLLVLPTPTAAGEIDLRTAVSVYAPSIPGILPDAGRMAIAMATRYAVLAYLVADSGQDFEIWKNKAHLPFPALAEGDGPIGSYRRWCRQFYV